MGTLKPSHPQDKKKTKAEIAKLTAQLRKASTGSGGLSGYGGPRGSMEAAMKAAKAKRAAAKAKAARVQQANIRKSKTTAARKKKSPSKSGRG